MIFFSIRSFFKKIVVIGLLPIWWYLTLSNPYQQPTHSSLYLDIKDSWQLDVKTQGFSTIESSLFKRACQGSLEVIEMFIQQWVKEKGFSFEEREIMYLMLDLLQGDYPLDSKTNGIERKYLPQTYVSAVFLLTMLPSQEIIAIPEGIKRRFDLYGSKINDITLTTDRRNFELIYLNKPCKAFTAFYTNPDIKRTLTLQSIPYVDIDKINTVEEIEEAMVDIGYHIDRPQTSFVIANFFKIAFKAIDLRIEAFFSDKDLIPKRVLLIESFQSYT